MHPMSTDAKETAPQSPTADDLRMEADLLEILAEIREGKTNARRIALVSLKDGYLQVWKRGNPDDLAAVGLLQLGVKFVLDAIRK